MNRTRQIFVVLRDAKKILVTEEIRELWEVRFGTTIDKPPTQHQFLNWIWRAYTNGLVWKVSKGVYQARPAETSSVVQSI